MANVLFSYSVARGESQWAEGASPDHLDLKKVAEAIQSALQAGGEPTCNDVLNAAGPALLSRNKKKVLDALAGCGITHAEITYIGGRDLGGVDQISFFPYEKDALDVDAFVTVSMLSVRWDPREKRVDIEENDLPLTEALSLLTDDLVLHSGYAGYEFDRGGGGTLTLDVEAGEAVLEHYRNASARVDYSPQVF
jgi:hypothetical protein